MNDTAEEISEQMELDWRRYPRGLDGGEPA